MLQLRILYRMDFARDLFSRFVESRENFIAHVHGERFVALPLRWFHYLAILILTPTETCQRVCYYGYWNLRARVS